MAIYQQFMETRNERKERELLIAKWGWQKFNQLFSDESACIEELNRRAAIKTHSYICDKCKSKVTIGTTIARVKKPRAWLAAVWLSEQGIQITTNQFAALANVAVSTSANILRKVGLLTDSNTQSHPTSVSSTVPHLDPQNLIKLSEYKLSQKRANARTEVLNETVLTVVPDENKSSEQTKSDEREGPEEMIKSATSEITGSKPDSARTEAFAKVKEELRALLSDVPQSLDQLQDKLDAPGDLVSIATVMLELDGSLTSLPGNRFVKATKKRTDRQTVKNRIDAKEKYSNQKSPLGRIFDIVKSAVADVSRVLLREAAQLFSTCNICNCKSLQKKI